MTLLTIESATAGCWVKLYKGSGGRKRWPSLLPFPPALSRRC